MFVIQRMRLVCGIDCHYVYDNGLCACCSLWQCRERNAIIILVLSISGGGGNYPIQVSGKFFQMINPFLPFTHAVNLLRESAGGIYWPNLGLPFGLWWGFQSSLVLAVQFFIHIWNTDRKICGFSKRAIYSIKNKS